MGFLLCTSCKLIMVPQELQYRIRSWRRHRTISCFCVHTVVPCDMFPCRVTPPGTAIAEKLSGDKIILFALPTTPHAENHYPLPRYNRAEPSRSRPIRFALLFSAPFAMNLIVRTPDTMKSGDWRRQLLRLAFFPHKGKPPL